jgi:hypothetical protein
MLACHIQDTAELAGCSEFGLSATLEYTYGISLTLTVLATAAAYEATTHAAANVIEKVGEEIGCVWHKTACFLTSLADKSGRTWGLTDARNAMTTAFKRGNGLPELLGPQVGM